MSNVQTSAWCQACQRQWITLGIANSAKRPQCSMCGTAAIGGPPPAQPPSNPTRSTV